MRCWWPTRRDARPRCALARTLVAFACLEAARWLVGTPSFDRCPDCGEPLEEGDLFHICWEPEAGDP